MYYYFNYKFSVFRSSLILSCNVIRMCTHLSVCFPCNNQIVSLIYMYNFKQKLIHLRYLFNTSSYSLVIIDRSNFRACRHWFPICRIILFYSNRVCVHFTNVYANPSHFWTFLLVVLTCFLQIEKIENARLIWRNFLCIKLS